MYHNYIINGDEIQEGKSGCKFSKICYIFTCREIEKYGMIKEKGKAEPIMMTIGVIGAGSISNAHLDAYQKNKKCNIKAIADLNEKQAKTAAENYEIPDVYTDYKELLSDQEIDAVSICTPTFTHKQIVLDALKAGKHVLCEKPPALNAEEVRECRNAQKESGKVLMFGLVCRFFNQTQYLKQYIESGKMGQIISAEAARVKRCFGYEKWFADRKKGGGFLKDAAIHQLDCAMYLMDYPKPKTVVASQTFLNLDLPEKMSQGESNWFYQSCDTGEYENNIETAITGFVTFENGACLHVKSASVLNTVESGSLVVMNGEHAGIKYNLDNFEVNLVELDYGPCFKESTPQVSKNSPFCSEISHFLDCCEKGTECICKVEEAEILMQIIDAMITSADTRQPVVFD